MLFGLSEFFIGTGSDVLQVHTIYYTVYTLLSIYGMLFERTLSSKSILINGRKTSIRSARFWYHLLKRNPFKGYNFQIEKQKKTFNLKRVKL